MDPSFRQPKYLNESGSQQGRYFLNRFDYFEFYQYPSYTKHKVFAIIGVIFALCLSSFIAIFSGVIFFLALVFCLYLCSLSILSFFILHRQICRYRGYFLIPKRWLAFWRSIAKEVDINDFDSTATINDKNSNH